MKKKITGITLIIMTLVMMSGLVAYANNHDDAPYKFFFNSGNSSTITRDKTDRSSSYMHCNYSQKAYTAYVFSWQGGYLIDCSYGHKYSFSTGTTHFMLNNVYESQYRNAGIYSKMGTAYSGYAEGLWSPDSV